MYPFFASLTHIFIRYHRSLFWSGYAGKIAYTSPDIFYSSIAFIQTTKA